MPTATINGTEYFFTDEGEGPLILFGHGLLAGHQMFEAQIAELKDRFRCVSIDWPGHGKTSFDKDWTFDDLADDTGALLDHLGADRAILAGLSQGGMIFMRFALAHPERVAGLILMDTSPGPENAENIDEYWQLAEMLRSDDDAVRRQAAEGARAVLWSQTWIEANPEEAEHELQLMLAHPPEGLFKACKAVFERDDVTERLGELDIPALVLVGADDIATAPAISEDMQRRLPDAELVIIDNAGHHTPIENPAAVTAALDRFLTKRFARATA